MSETKLKWGIKINKMGFPEIWSLGVCLSHWGDETYLFLNLIFVTVSIGKMNLEVKE